MAKESVLTFEEKESIEIEKLIFHIIINDDFRPQFLDEVEISEEQIEFFKKRLIDVAHGTQYMFVGKDENEVFKFAKSIVENPEANFLQASKNLTNKFQTLHTKNTNDGVFITVLVRILDKKQLIFLLKLDHKKVYEYKRKKNKALLEEVKNTFIEDKTAIQKVALIDVSNNYAWDVLAYDRVKPSSLTEYFAKYLSVLPRETPSKLTDSAISCTYRWAVENKAFLDDKQEVSNYKTRAINYLLDADLFKSDDFINYVIHDEDPERKRRLITSFTDFLIDKGLYGQAFVPSKSVISNKTKKNIRLTNEGVKIEWSGEPDENGIIIPNERNISDGLYHIVIKTSDYKNIQ